MLVDGRYGDDDAYVSELLPPELTAAASKGLE